MRVNQLDRDTLLELARKKIYLEGNVLKILKPSPNDKELEDYLKECKEKDIASRKKRMEVAKEVQQQNKELEQAAKENEKLMVDLKVALEKTEKLKDEAIGDLELLQKKTQFELVGHIVRMALWVIVGVGSLTTMLYVYVMAMGYDSKIIESTWSNLFGILLTNSFSIVGTIMGVKYATNDK